MAKKCIIKTNEQGVISVNLKNYDNITDLEIAIKRNGDNPMDKTSKGEDSLLYKFYINDMKMSPNEAEFVMTSMFSNEFGDWFGKWWEADNKNVSQVRDKYGQPKPVWSGHEERLSEHKAYTKREEEDRIDNDAFFPENKKVAQSYSTKGSQNFMTMTSEQYEKAKANSVEPVFLNIRNPKEVENNSGVAITKLIQEGQAENNDGFVGNSNNTKNQKAWAILDDSQVIYINDQETDSSIYNDDLVEEEEIITEDGLTIKDFMNELLPKSENNPKIVKELNMIYVLQGAESIEKLKAKWKLKTDDSRQSEWDELMSELGIEDTSENNNINLQNETQQEYVETPYEILSEVIKTLMKKRLVNKVHIDTSEELLKVLKEFGINEETMKQMEVWHGSPHLFDRFSTEFMGTGEGAQAFGWGLYFTDLKGIAENYASTLTDNKNNEPILKTDADLTENEISTLTQIINNNAYKTLKDVEKHISDLPTIGYQAKDWEVLRSLLPKIKEHGLLIQYNNKNLYNVSLHRGKTPEQYNWLEWDIETPDSILKAINLENENFYSQFDDAEIQEVEDDGEVYYAILVNNINVTEDLFTTSSSAYNALERLQYTSDKKYTGNEVYDFLIEKKGSPREASLFLLENGIDGVKYPAESIARGATSDNARGFNYVVFDENAVTIKEVVQLQNTLNSDGIKLVPNGFYRPSTREIYLNSENPNILETTVHEFAHPFLQYLRDNRPAHYKAGVKLLETNREEAKTYVDFVKRTQPSLEEGTQDFYEEVLAQIVGNNGAQLINSTEKGSIKEWLENLWSEIAKLVGITSVSPEDISKMTLREFSDAVTAEMLDRTSAIEVQQKEFIPSQLFEELLEQPFMTQEQALDLYKNIYTEDLNHWKDADMNC